MLSCQGSTVDHHHSLQHKSQHKSQQKTEFSTQVSTKVSIQISTQVSIQVSTPVSIEVGLYAPHTTASVAWLRQHTSNKVQLSRDPHFMHKIRQGCCNHGTLPSLQLRNVCLLPSTALSRQTVSAQSSAVCPVQAGAGWCRLQSTVTE